ncbi:MAG: hypothetical protein M1814_000480 [Vezdaea aestivalis]|nr:MAG: hypothetical protein M1814_000480 [Vezdaea aestivalis]
MRHLRIDAAPDSRAPSLGSEEVFERMQEKYNVISQYECIALVIGKARNLDSFVWTPKSGPTDEILSALTESPTLHSLTLPASHYPHVPLNRCVLWGLCRGLASVSINNIQAFEQLNAILPSGNAYRNLQLVFNSSQVHQELLKSEWSSMSGVTMRMPRVENLEEVQSLSIADCPISLELLLDDPFKCFQPDGSQAEKTKLASLRKLELIRCKGEESVLTRLGSTLESLSMITSSIWPLAQFLLRSDCELNFLSLVLSVDLQHFPSDLLCGIGRFHASVRHLQLDGRTTDFVERPVYWPREKWHNFVLPMPDLETLGIRIKNQPSSPEITLEDLAYPRLDQLKRLRIFGFENVSIRRIESTLQIVYSSFLDTTRKSTVLGRLPGLRQVIVAERIYDVEFLPGLDENGASLVRRLVLRKCDDEDHCGFWIDPPRRWIG